MGGVIISAVVKETVGGYRQPESPVRGAYCPVPLSIRVLVVCDCVKLSCRHGISAGPSAVTRTLSPSNLPHHRHCSNLHSSPTRNKHHQTTRPPSTFTVID